MSEVTWSFGDGVVWDETKFYGAAAGGQPPYAFVGNWVAHFTALGRAIGFYRGLGATSSTSRTPALGEISFDLDQDVLFPVGAFVRVKSESAADHYVKGEVVSLVAGTLTVNARHKSGSTAKTDWVIGNEMAVGDPPRATLKSANFAVAHGSHYMVDASAADVTVTCNATPQQGDRFGISDAADSFGANDCIIDGNGKSIKRGGLTGDRYVLNQPGARVMVEFNETLDAWLIND